MFRRLPSITTLLCFAFAPLASAEVKLNPLFSTNAVIQRGDQIPVWGTANDGEKVTVELQGKTASATASGGKWMVRLDGLQPGGPFDMTVRGENVVTVKNLLIGDVWLCTGQSNMEWALARSDGGPQAIASATNSMLRMGRIPHNVQDSPQTEVAVQWQECSPATAKNFSAIPYWFGDKLQRATGVPIGILNSAFGGTTIQAWLPLERLKSGSWAKDRWTDPELAKAEYAKKVEEARPIREKYEADKAAALANKQPAPPMPTGIPSEYKGPTTLWNGEVAPILPLKLRGIAWYQGESNAYVTIANNYGDYLSVLVEEYRKGFEQPDLPILIFQIARNRKPQVDPNEKTGIAVLQEAQAKVVAKTPKTALVVSNDMGGADVHYTGKEPVADRAVGAALSLAYNRPTKYQGPTFREAKFEGGKAIVSFDHAESGLEAKGDKLAGFVVAGKDQKFAFADATIEGDKVIVSSPQVTEPVAVRYGWADLPNVNLFNKEGFPAATFRSDSWAP